MKATAVFRAAHSDRRRVPHGSRRCICGRRLSWRAFSSAGHGSKSLQTGKPHAPWSWADTYPIARLRIPRLGYDEIVLEGATPRTLAFGPARLFSGAGLGEPGNLVLAGHRTSWFRPLQSIAQGDQIDLEWFDSRSGVLRERIYTVTLIRVVQPQDVGLLEPTSEDALTLITCYPFGRGPLSPQRYIVRALPS